MDCGLWIGSEQTYCWFGLIDLHIWTARLFHLFFFFFFFLVHFRIAPPFGKYSISIQSLHTYLVHTHTHIYIYIYICFIINYIHTSFSSWREGNQRKEGRKLSEKKPHLAFINYWCIINNTFLFYFYSTFILLYLSLYIPHPSSILPHPSPPIHQSTSTESLPYPPSPYAITETAFYRLSSISSRFLQHSSPLYLSLASPTQVCLR